MHTNKTINRAFLSVGFLLAMMGRVSAQEPGNERPETTEEKEAFGTYPWEYPNFSGYDEPITTSALDGPSGQPEKYQAYVTRVPEGRKVDSNSVAITAHIPENATIWFDDVKASGTGTLRKFRSPPLDPTGTYVYSIRIAWVENGKLVSQTQKLNVTPGGKYSIFLMQPKGTLEPKNGVAANLAKLSTKDRALAEKQKFCAVHDGIKLGAVGVPVKITIKGQPVFLSSDACLAEANSNPEKTLAKAKELQAKSERSDSN